MKLFGFVLIAAGFLAGSYLTSLDPRLVQWSYFLPALVIGLGGVALVRMSTRQAAQADEKVSSDIQVIEKSLSSLVSKVGDLDAEKGSIHTYDMRHKIDELLLEDLDAFAEARETISHLYGLHAYADIMSHFAGGERYLNRVWSASADGYIDEVNAYIGHALEQFRAAQALVNQAKYKR